MTALARSADPWLQTVRSLTATHNRAAEPAPRQKAVHPFLERLTRAWERDHPRVASQRHRPTIAAAVSRSRRARDRTAEQRDGDCVLVGCGNLPLRLSGMARDHGHVRRCLRTDRRTHSSRRLGVSAVTARSETTERIGDDSCGFHATGRDQRRRFAGPARLKASPRQVKWHESTTASCGRAFRHVEQCIFNPRRF